MGKKWANISKQMSGRTENAVKNRFISLCRTISVRDKGKKAKQKNLVEMIDDIKKNMKEWDITEKKVKIENSEEKPKNLVIPYPQKEDPVLEFEKEHIDIKHTSFESLRRKSNELTSKLQLENIMKQSNNPETATTFFGYSPLVNNHQNNMEVSPLKLFANLNDSRSWDPKLSPKIQIRQEISTPNFANNRSSEFKTNKEYPMEEEKRDSFEENSHLFQKPKLAIFTRNPNNNFLSFDNRNQSSIDMKDDPFTNFDALLINSLKMDMKSEHNNSKRSDILVRKPTDIQEDLLLQLHSAGSPWLPESTKEITPFVKLKSPLGATKERDVVSPIIAENKTYIFDISSFSFPNMYKKYQNEEDDISTPDKVIENVEKERQVRFFDEISQKMSSLSISDQFIAEANKVLSISGMSPLFSDRFSERMSSFFQSSLSSSLKNDKSLILINNNSSSKDDDEKKSHISQKSRFFIRKTNDLDSSLLDGADHVIFTRNGQRCRTQLIQRKPPVIKNEESANNSETIDKGFDVKKELSDHGNGRRKEAFVPVRKGKKSTTVKLEEKTKERLPFYEAN